MQDFFASNLEPFVRSRPVPKQSGPVLTVVGSTFRDVVLNSDKDVVVVMATDRCQPCDEMVALLREVAAKHRKNKELVFATFDPRANDAPPEFAVKKFPTAYFVPRRGGSGPVRYGGGLDAGSLELFIQENAVAESLAAERDEL